MDVPEAQCLGERWRVWGRGKCDPERSKAQEDSHLHLLLAPFPVLGYPTVQPKRRQTAFPTWKREGPVGPSPSASICFSPVLSSVCGPEQGSTQTGTGADPGQQASAMAPAGTACDVWQPHTPKWGPQSLLPSLWFSLLSLHILAHSEAHTAQSLEQAN